jgi:hypothetical protein
MIDEFGFREDLGGIVKGFLRKIIEDQLQSRLEEDLPIEFACIREISDGCFRLINFRFD